MNTLTKADFDFFKKKVKYWVNRLNLKNKVIYVDFVAIDDNVVADVVNEDKLYTTFTIRLNTSNSAATKAATKKLLESTALHEVLHVLLSDIERYTFNRFIPDKDTILKAFEDTTETLTKGFLNG